MIMKQEEKLVVPREIYLSAGVHIGTTTKTADMKKYVYKVRPSGLAVLNIKMVDDALREVAKQIIEKEKVLVVSRKESSNQAAEKFAEIIGSKFVSGRFMPGTMTNPQSSNFFEPDILVTTDVISDSQSIVEARKMNVPVVSFSDTSNEVSHIDYVIPCNNKGKKSIALLFWILAKLVCEGKNMKFENKPDDFGYI